MAALNRGGRTSIRDLDRSQEFKIPVDSQEVKMPIKLTGPYFLHYLTSLSPTAQVPGMSNQTPSLANLAWTSLPQSRPTCSTLQGGRSDLGNLGDYPAGPPGGTQLRYIPAWSTVCTRLCVCHSASLDTYLPFLLSPLSEKNNIITSLSWRAYLMVALSLHLRFGDSSDWHQEPNTASAQDTNPRPMAKWNG